MDRFRNKNIKGQYLNPRDKKTILETNEDDAVKTALEIKKNR